MIVPPDTNESNNTSSHRRRHRTVDDYDYHHQQHHQDQHDPSSTSQNYHRNQHHYHDQRYNKEPTPEYAGIKSPMPVYTSYKRPAATGPSEKHQQRGRSGLSTRRRSSSSEEKKLRRRSSKEGGKKISSRRKPKKFVTFFDQARMKNTMHLNDYTVHEINATWYDEDEMFDIRQEVRATLNVMTATTEATAANAQNNNNYNSSSFHTNKNNSNENAKKTFHLAQLLCCRGLENLSDEGVERRAMIRETARIAVLGEQQRQRQLGIRDEHLLAMIYKANCQRSCIVATMLGALDATESMNVLEEDIMNSVLNTNAEDDDLLNGYDNDEFGDEYDVNQYNALMQDQMRHSYQNHYPHHYPHQQNPLLHVMVPRQHSFRKQKKKKQLEQQQQQQQLRNNGGMNPNDTTSPVSPKLDPMEMGRIINGLMAHMHV